MAKEQAPEALPAGPFAGGNPIPIPVEGTTDDFGTVVGAPVDSAGAGAGANKSGPTEVGGAMRGGNCCGPASSKPVQKKHLTTKFKKSKLCL